ncbi:HlyD family secretion protein [Roseibium aggregatum]|uniref:HlyD family secretion protein n=1 Tax=Roseibium aggregatum TaxID=187304 RepID=UPI0025AB94C7|nr:HlyD family secretion protein [Roseibium aggregatum]WJS05813.1 HlyD family secretion protein [Roseibium aggregatum]
MMIVRKYGPTGLIVLLAAGLVWWTYSDYLQHPWTRDGLVQADVIQIAPRVSGPVVELNVTDNQFVEQGTLLFRIDPSTYQTAVNQAEANLAVTRDQVNAQIENIEASKAALTQAEAQIGEAEAILKSAEAEVHRSQVQLNRVQDLNLKGFSSSRDLDDATAQYNVDFANMAEAEARVDEVAAQALRAKADLAEAVASLGRTGEFNAQIRAAKAALDTAKLNLEFTKVFAPKDSYLGKLNIRLGSQAVANQPVIALIDSSSFRVDGYFKETDIAGVTAGDAAVVTLMSYPDTPLAGQVQSLGWGISQQNGSSGNELLPDVSPTFEWIRLAQRIPVRIHLKDVPESIDLRMGTTASVLLRKGDKQP